MNRHRVPEPPEPSKPRARPESRRRFYLRFLLVIAGMDAGSGIAYLTGPVTAPNLELIAQAAPIWACGIVFAAVGALLAAGRKGRHFYLAAGFAGGVLWLIWGGALLLTVVQGTATSAVGLPLYGGLAVLHLLVVYGARTGLIGGR